MLQQYFTKLLGCIPCIIPCLDIKTFSLSYVTDILSLVSAMPSSLPSFDTVLLHAVLAVADIAVVVFCGLRS
jgi:hypothetical protein